MSAPASPKPEFVRSASSNGFVNTRFDPMADERSRLQAQTAASFDVCHPALALRAVVLVQAVLAVVALGLTENLAGWAARQATLAFGGVAGTLLWLVAVCALRQPLQALSAALRATLVLMLGALAALAAWWPLLWAGLGGEVQPLRTLAVALGGAGFAALLWAWLDLRARIWQPADASARLAELQSRIRPHHSDIQFQVDRMFRGNPRGKVTLPDGCACIGGLQFA